MKISPRRVVAISTGVLALLSFSRVVVLVLESLSVVSDERAQDIELLEVCKKGVARGSLKMRSACLQAQAERASPILLKAFLRAFSTAYSDFCASVSTPSRMAVVFLFLLSSVFLPVSQWARALLPSEPPSAKHVVVVEDSPRSRIRSRISGALRLRKRPSDTNFYESDDDDANPEVKMQIDEESEPRLKFE